MADMQNPTNGADASKAGTSSADAGGTSSSTPSSTPADAGQGGKTPEERAAYFEAEAKKSFAQRDSYKSQLDALQVKAKRADELEQKEAERLKAQRDAEEADAVKRGEYQKVVDGQKAKIAELEARQADLEKKHSNERAALQVQRETERKESAIELAYKAAGGFDPDIVTQPAIRKAIDDGSIKIEDGKVVGIEPVLASLKKAKGHLFRNPDDKGSPGATGGSPPQTRKLLGNGKAGSLAEGPRFTNKERLELMKRGKL